MKSIKSVLLARAKKALLINPHKRYRSSINPHYSIIRSSDHLSPAWRNRISDMFKPGHNAENVLIIELFLD